MANNSDPRCRQCRREGEKLFLKGEKCIHHCTLDGSRKTKENREGTPRNKPPGQHGGNMMRRKVTEYGVQLREKQKLRRIYRVLESQFRNYLAEALRRQGVTGDNLLQLLEMRLDNVVFRLGLASSRAHSRQLVSHRFFTVNGRRVNIPSYQVRPGDTIGVHTSKSQTGAIKEARQKSHTRGLPQWLEFNNTSLVGKIVMPPTRDQIDTNVEEQLIVEFYSR